MDDCNACAVLERHILNSRMIDYMGTDSLCLMTVNDKSARIYIILAMHQDSYSEALVF